MADMIAKEMHICSVVEIHSFYNCIIFKRKELNKKIKSNRTEIMYYKDPKRKKQKLEPQQLITGYF
jgi:hypothetical protein